jgi:hypothetical protein
MSHDRIQELEAELSFLREWIISNTRRINDIEANAFFLEETEEVILVTIPKKQ